MKKVAATILGYAQKQEKKEYATINEEKNCKRAWAIQIQNQSCKAYCNE
jgi:hypothetical protein